MTRREQPDNGRSLLWRAIRFAAGSVVTVLLLLEIPLLPGAFSHAGEARLLMYALPQGVILAVLIGFPLGVFLGVGGRIVSRRSAGAILALAVVSSALSIATFTSLLPAANRAARESESGADDRTLTARRTELTFSELREQRDSATRQGCHEYARDLDVYYHTRWAFSFAPLAFILLALSVVVWRPIPQSIMGIAFCGIFAAYYILSRVGMETGLGGKLPALLAAWLPNLALVTTAILVASSRLRGSLTPAR
jgi:lipopolysaccharide export LptBFGC system permease protein LptF